MLARVALALLALFLSGCARCGHRAEVDAGPPPLVPDTFPPAPRTWTYQAVREAVRGIALPERCSERAPLVRADVATSTRFVAEERSLGTLIVVDATDDRRPRVTGAAAVVLDPAGASRDPLAIPWFEAGAMPRFARTEGGAWIAALERRAAGHHSRILLWRSGGVDGGAPTTPSAEVLGDAAADGFEPVDMACAGDRCAVLTTRLGAGEPPGANVWLGRIDEPARSWKRVDIAPPSPDSEARPFALASTTEPVPGKPSVIAAIEEGTEIVLWAADDPTGARPIARLPAPYDALDVIGSPEPLALVYGAEIDADGCSRGGAKLRLESSGRPGREIAVSAPPLGGSLRRLGEGTLATWIAPVGCGAARHVLYGVVVDASGAPTTAPTPIGDATSYAIASKAADVDLWIQRERTVTWVRMTCRP